MVLNSGRKYPEFREHEWQNVLKAEDEVSMMVFQKEDGVFVAICNFQDFQGDHVDIGYDVEEEYRGKGIGTSLVIDLVSLAHLKFPGKEVIARIRVNNSVSRRVAEKAGGVMVRYEPTPEAKLFVESLKKYGDGKPDENGHYASEKEISAWKRVVDEGKEGIRVYKMP